MRNVYQTRTIARDMLNQQPFTQACRARHIIVPVYDRNLLGEKVSEKPIGYAYRLRSANE